MSDDNNLVPPLDYPEIVRRMRARTPARIFVARGAAYSTGMQLELRQARASAVDAVWNEFDLNRDFPVEFVFPRRPKRSLNFCCGPILGGDLVHRAKISSSSDV
jgi:hypothetical protein